MKFGHGIFVGAFFTLLVMAAIVAIHDEKPPIANTHFVSNAPFTGSLFKSGDSVRVADGFVDTVVAGDMGHSVEYTNGQGTDVTLPNPKRFPSFHYKTFATLGTVTITAQDGMKIDGQEHLVIREGECRDIHFVKDHYEAYACEVQP